MKIVFGLFLFALITLSCKDKKESASIYIPADGEVINSRPAINKAMYKDIEVSGAIQYIKNNPDLIILDVRTPGETDNGVIENAIKIDYKNSNFDAEITKLDRSKAYLVYCGSGGRSVNACKKMSAAGFTNLTNMKGGYSAWK